MTTKRDYYEILGIEKGASESDIKRAYRAMAMKFHPDKNPGDQDAEEKFKEIGEAYEVLKDPQKRARYDRFGHQDSQRGFSGGFEGFDFDLADALRTFMSEGFGFGDFFGQGTSRRRSSKPRGADLQIRLKLTLEEIATGVDKKIKLRKYVRCDECGGSGAAQGYDKSTCPVCRGTGEVRQVQNTMFGQFVNIGTCSNCHGDGQILAKPCPKCGGDGRIKDDTSIKVKVPAGVATGNYMQQEGQGHAGPRGGSAGNLIILFEEKEHQHFQRHGDDILYELPLSFSQVALGDEVEVPTLNGKSKLHVSAGTQSGKILRMKGKGIPRLHSHGRGDQLVRIVVWTPEKLNEDEKKLFAELAKSERMNPPKDDESFMKKFKDAFF
ncbi:molecular chaperone DnaJ [candidate division KSB1 bacterium]|nr:molecular chaperone DnaJ [candidate division KSB1 bacterium]